MNKSFLGIALAAHELWLRDDERGNRFVAPSSADLSYANLSSADLRYANLRSADLSYADLSYADLSYANLRSANLRYADLRSADLSYANLRSANLRSADLRYADLRSANLRSANRIIGTQRSDGYLFTLCTETQRVLAGCRAMSIADYIEHCDTYSDASKKSETLAILKCLELLAAARKTTNGDDNA